MDNMDLPIPGTLLDAPELHALLLGIEHKLGLPNQILGPNLRIRWDHNGTELLQLQLRPRNNGGTPPWEITPSIENREKLLYDEYLDIEYAGDPDMGGDIPYAWNLGLNPTNWIQGLMSPIFTWENLCYYIGNTLAELPMTLAALPPSWLDSKAIVHDPTMKCFTAVASRDGLQVTLLRVSGDYRGTHQFAIPAHTALHAGKPLIETYAANFSLGFPVSQTGIKMEIVGPQRLSDFYCTDYSIDDEDDPATRETKGPEYHDHITSLRELSEWHYGPIPGEIMAENQVEFPEWK